VTGLLAHRGAQLIGRQDLRVLPTPAPTETHKPVPHATIVQALIESLGFRRFTVVEDQYAVTPDSMRMFGVLTINVEESGVRFVVGVRNSHDKSFSLGLTVGYRVFVCDNLAFTGDFTPITRKHTAHFEPVEIIDVGVGRMQRHFEPMKQQIDVWKHHTLPDDSARLLIYRAFIEGGLAVPRRLAPAVHHAYFHPAHPDFEPRTAWSLSNAFTAAFKELPPVARFQGTAKLGTFLGGHL
jgi:hypothetical protein